MSYRKKDWGPHPPIFLLVWQQQRSQGWFFHDATHIFSLSRYQQFPYCPSESKWHWICVKSIWSNSYSWSERKPLLDFTVQYTHNLVQETVIKSFSNIPHIRFRVILIPPARGSHYWTSLSCTLKSLSKKLSWNLPQIFLSLDLE